MENQIKTENEIKQESIFIPVNDTDKLHLKRFYKNTEGPVVFMLHGSIENGKIFYSSSGKGLAPYLANNGFDVFIADLRGRGQSTPAINKDSAYGQTEAITEDLPAFIEKIREIRGDTRQHWIAHSWGGIMLLSVLSRFSKYCEFVDSLVFLGARRRITVLNLEKLIKINFFWYFFGFIMVKRHGFLPAKKIGFGSDNETAKSHAQSTVWVKGKPWVDPQDNFNYEKAFKKIKIPPLLLLTGTGDHCLANTKDIIKFYNEIGNENTKYQFIGKKFGNKNDYDHINLLTHQDAINDHFPIVLEWIKETNLKI